MTLLQAARELLRIFEEMKRTDDPDDKRRLIDQWLRVKGELKRAVDAEQGPPCPNCNATGQIHRVSPLGTFTTTHVCEACGGRGEAP